MDNQDKKTFQDFFNEGMENIVSTAFPQLSKFVSFDRDKQNDEDKAASSVSETENENGTPNRRRRASQNTVAAEMVVDGLDAIDQRLRTQSIVLVSSLEQQTITNQFLSRIVDGGAGGVGNGSGGSLDHANDMPGGSSILKLIKKGIGKLFGGAAPEGAEAVGGLLGAGAATTAGVAAAAAAAGYGLYKNGPKPKRDYPIFQRAWRQWAS
jgi:hypothetical protein